MAILKWGTEQDPVTETMRGGEADSDALVVSHLEKLEHWEGWRNAGRDAGMLHVHRGDTQHGTMWGCQYQLF